MKHSMNLADKFGNFYSTYSGSMKNFALLADSLTPHISQLLALDCNVISIIVDIVKGHCLMGRYMESLQLPSKDLCCGWGLNEKDDNVIHFLYQCSSLVNYLALPSLLV